MPDRPVGRPAPKRPRPLALRERAWRTAVIGGTGVTLVLVISLVGYAIYDRQVLAPQRPVAVVDGQTITAAKFLGRYELRRLDLQNQLNSSNQMLSLFAGNEQFEGYLRQQVDQIAGQLANPLALGQQVLDELIEDLLIERELVSRGVAVPEEDIDREIERGFGFVEEPSGATPSPVLPTALATGTPRPTSTPAPTATAYTRQDFQADYQANLGQLRILGISEGDYRARIRAELARELWRGTLAEAVPREEEQVWARHILVGDATKGLEVLERLQSGEKWEDLAAELSLDSGTRDNAGDLGWFPRGEMVAEFEDRAFAAAVGEVVGPFHSQFGWHLLEVLGHEVRSLDESRYGQRVDAAFQDWLLQMRSQSEIQVDGRWADLVSPSG